MNKQVWDEYLVKLNDNTRVEAEYPDHLRFTVEFFKACNIDDPNTTLLDAGCGTNILKDKIESDWYGCDMNTNPDVNWEDLHDLKLYDESAGIIFCNHTLEHVLSPTIVLTELKRVMTNDGHMVIGVPLYPYFKAKNHMYLLSRESWKHMFWTLGLKVIKENDSKECGIFLLVKE